jgi:CRISPR-associated protein Csb2
MIAVRLHFPAGRYHANPWGRHVNEGAAEWPPSPYRLLRALYDVWKRKRPDIPEPEIADALGALAATLPHFRLPPAVPSHTRSYLSSNRTDPSKKSLIFDAFLAVDRGNANTPPEACWIVWPEITLAPRPRALLERLFRDLNYLGRSESWIEADLLDCCPEGGLLCRPLQDPDASGEFVSVACAAPPSEYEGHWLDALTASTTDVLKSRRNAPPLLRMVRYLMPPGAVLADPPEVRPPDPRKEQALILSLDSPVLPLVTATIEVAEQVRVRLMGAHRRLMGGDETKVSPLFSGKHGGVKRLDHGHVFILPLRSDKLPNRIDRILLLSRRKPFTHDELEAARGVRELWQEKNRPKVRCVVSWQGGLHHPAGRTAQTVVSSTPFVTVRHLRKGRDPERFFEEEIRRECRNLGYEEPVRIERRDVIPGSPFAPVEYRRNRKQDPPRPGYSFRLTFAQPEPTPLSLGYACHFGLGQFVAET